MDTHEKSSARPPYATDADSGARLHALVLLALTAGALYCCYLMTVPFLPAIAWALALAVLFAPLQRALESAVRHPGAAAALSVLIIGVLGAGATWFVADRMLGEVLRGVEEVRGAIASGEWRRVFGIHPLIAPAGAWIEREVDLPGMAQTAASWLTGTATTFVRGSLVQLVGVVLIFYVLFYLLRDRVAALAALRRLLPLPRADMDRLFDAVFATVHATVYGTLAVAAVQGALGGLMFWWLDLPAPLLWGVVMGLLAVIPVLGAFIVWIPAAIYLVLTGHPGQALLLAVWGGVIVGGIDNLLYPMLVGRRLKMHTIVAFVSIVGGLLVFGPSGLILGPVSFTVARVLLEVWHRRNTATG